MPVSGSGQQKMYQKQVEKNPCSNQMGGNLIPIMSYLTLIKKCLKHNNMKFCIFLNFFSILFPQHEQLQVQIVFQIYINK